MPFWHFLRHFVKNRPSKKCRFGIFYGSGDDRVNHTEIINLVQQGVQQAMATVHPPAVDILQLEEVSEPASSLMTNSASMDLTMQTVQQQMQMMQCMLELLQANNEPRTKKSTKNTHTTDFDEILSHSWSLQSHQCRMSHTSRQSQT